MSFTPSFKARVNASLDGKAALVIVRLGTETARRRLELSTLANPSDWETNTSGIAQLVADCCQELAAAVNEGGERVHPGETA